MNLNLDFYYWGDTFYYLKTVVLVSGAISALIGTLGIILELSDGYEIAKSFIVATIVGFILCIIGVFIPSKEYIYAKGIAENISNNEEVISNTVETTIDKIIEAIHSKED